MAEHALWPIPFFRVLVHRQRGAEPSVPSRILGMLEMAKSGRSWQRHSCSQQFPPSYIRHVFLVAVFYFY